MNNYPSAIGDVLFTKTQQRVLALLYARPERSFYLNEIVRLADMGKGTIGRELQKLASVDLITVNKQGNQTHYQANSNNPVFNELKGLVDKTFGVVGVLTTAIEPLLPDIEFAFVYGSIAQGRESAESDIDLMMVADRMSYSDLMSRLLEAEQRLNRKINPTLYSTKEFNDRIVNQQNFIARVLEKNILWLHGKSSFDLKRYNGQAEAS